MSVESNPSFDTPLPIQAANQPPQIEELINSFRERPRISTTIMLAYGTSATPREGTMERRRLEEIKSAWRDDPAKARRQLTMLLATRGDLSEALLEEIDGFGRTISPMPTSNDA